MEQPVDDEAHEPGLRPGGRGRPWLVYGAFCAVLAAVVLVRVADTREGPILLVSGLAAAFELATVGVYGVMAFVLMLLFGHRSVTAALVSNGVVLGVVAALATALGLF